MRRIRREELRIFNQDAAKRLIFKSRALFILTLHRVINSVIEMLMATGSKAVLIFRRIRLAAV